MKALITASGQFGPFTHIETLADRYRCDGVDYQFDVIGSATIGEYVAPPPEPVKPVVPEKVTRRQAKQSLALAGLLDQVQPAIDAITDPLQRQLMQIEWDDSQVFERNRPSMIALATGLGLTSQQLDALFIEASKL